MSTVPPKEEEKKEEKKPLSGTAITIIVVVCVFALLFFGFLIYKNWYEDNEYDTYTPYKGQLPSRSQQEQALISRVQREILPRR